MKVPLPQNLTNSLLKVENLSETFGENVTDSPLTGFLNSSNFIEDDTDRILLDISVDNLLKANRPKAGALLIDPPSFEMAGPRRKIFWNSQTTKVAIVTCGGLAPGLNNVVQSIVSVLYERYMVKNIFGVPFGYHGFSHDPVTKRFEFGWRRLEPLTVQNIDFEGGSVLGVGRGHSNPKQIVDALILRDINILFTIGGDGTLKGAAEIDKEIKSRNLPISLIGIPKTIDNDVPWVSKTFGFETAIGKAVDALRSAQAEARSAYHGIGMVKLMGRHSGALTATAAAAMNDLDFVLIPEIPVKLDGEKGLLNHLMQKIQTKGYLTIAVGEGAGQELLGSESQEKDASGNIKLKDFGKYLQKEIIALFKERNMDLNLKYIDPSYMLRAQATSPTDALFCTSLGQNAVHAAMAGKTAMLIGYTHECFTHVPFSALQAYGKKTLNINSPLWLSVLATTGQPPFWE